MQIEKIERKKLTDLFSKGISQSLTNFVIEGVNPFYLNLDGIEYYLYIKNLSPAQLSNKNPDIWRIQLPIRDIFSDIKSSSILFILLGYDMKNDVYATWNPYWVKQRLNVAKSVSFYSRFSLQVEAREMKLFRRYKLNNDGEVVVFPRDMMLNYLNNVHNFFNDDSEFVAMGSRKRQSANEAYKSLTNTHNIKIFAEYLKQLGYSERTISNYCDAVLTLINDGYFSKNKKIFLIYDTIQEYSKAIEIFMKIPEIKKLNAEWHYTFSSALCKYVKFLMGRECNYFEAEQKDDNKTISYSLESVENNLNSDNTSNSLTNDQIENNYECDCVDNEGKLTRIINPKLIELLRPLLDTEYQSLPKAFNVIEEFYGERYINAMELKDWQMLLDQIDWMDPYSTNTKKENRKSKIEIIRVTLPNGKVVQERIVFNTLIEVVEYVGIDRVRALNIISNGDNLITEKVNPMYETALKPLSNGLYINTQSSTRNKFEIIKRISKDLNIGIETELMTLKDTAYKSQIINNQKYLVSRRQKIRVSFPNGRIIQPNKVLESLIEVVKYAKPENVRKLGINVSGGNLILTKQEINPKYAVSTKPVGELFFVNTSSDTVSKFVQMRQISDDLNLGLLIEIV